VSDSNEPVSNPASKHPKQKKGERLGAMETMGQKPQRQAKKGNTVMGQQSKKKPRQKLVPETKEGGRVRGETLSQARQGVVPAFIAKKAGRTKKGLKR